MSVFRVGLRVRVRTDVPPEFVPSFLAHLLGAEGQIVSRVPHLFGDVWYVTTTRGSAACAECALQPIQPEGWKPVELEECYWQPEHLRAPEVTP